jgi:hypothetical protein
MYDCKVSATNPLTGVVSIMEYQASDGSELRRDYKKPSSAVGPIL